MRRSGVAISWIKYAVVGVDLVCATGSTNVGGELLGPFALKRGLSEHRDCVLLVSVIWHNVFSFLPEIIAQRFGSRFFPILGCLSAAVLH